MFVKRLIALAAALTILTSCRTTEFERQHDNALAQNPSGVELRIGIVGGRKRFRVAEPIEMEESYTAKYPGQWHIEILDGSNLVYFGDEFIIFDGHGIEKRNIRNHAGIVCCDSRHVWLSLDPVRLPYPFPIQTLEGAKPSSPRMFHFDHPGKYQLYLTSHRVFSREQSFYTPDGLGYAVTSSNIVSVEVLP